MTDSRDQQERTDLNKVNRSKEEISTAYKVWYEVLPPKEENIRQLRDEIFHGYTSSGGRELVDVLQTSQELAESNKYVFTQEDVTQYYTKEATKRRRRGLRKGELFEPPVVLADILPVSQRENREEGLHRAPYKKMLESEATKSLATSARSPIDTLSYIARWYQLISGERWIREEEWVGERKLNDEEVDLRLAQIVADSIDIDLENLVDYHRKVAKINGSGPTYINKHDQHLIPHSQGGLSQRPLNITSHWYEHLLVANDALEALEIVLPIQDLYADPEGDGPLEGAEEINRLTQLIFNAWKANAPGAELLRGSIPLSPNLSTKCILETREDICSKAESIIKKTETLDSEDAFRRLSEKNRKDLLSLAAEIEKGRGSLVIEEENEEKDPLPTSDQELAVKILEDVIEEIDCNRAISRLRESLNKLGRYDSSSLVTKHIVNIQNLIERLNQEKKALYLNSLNVEEYNSILELQETLDEDILIDIVIPYKIRNVRPAWRYRLDLEEMKDILTINPYDDKGLELRMLLDVLQAPFFKSVLYSNGVPRRVEFSGEQLLDSSLSEKVFGDLRYVDMLKGYIANGILNEYYKSVDLEDSRDIIEAMFPDRNNEQPPSALQNVDRAAQTIYEAIKNEEGIATIGDCDQDGFFASINWRWTLEHMGVKSIEQKFNTRLEGHTVQPIDLLNIALDGNSLVIINDTGSSEVDAQTFEMIKNGAESIEDLMFFRDNIELISGFNNLSPHIQRELKKKLTEIIHKDIIGVDFAELLETKISTGEKYKDKTGKIKKVYMKLEGFEPLTQFIKGFPDLKIIVCDHHTASIEGIQYFKDKKNVVMVNPQWVREGSENTFIKKMQKALLPNKDGHINVKEIDRIQRKYICYPESDIVGAVTATKVMKRVMQLFGPDDIVKAEAKELYSLDRGEGIEKYREIASEICQLETDKRYSHRYSNSLRETTLQLSDDIKIEISLEDLWLEVEPLPKVKSRITEVLKSLQYVAKKLGEDKNRVKVVSLLRNIETNWPVKISDKADLVDSLLNSKISLNRLDTKYHLERLIHQTENQYEERLGVARIVKDISDAELRFYLDYAKQLPKSIFEMERDEKEAYVELYVIMLAKELEDRTVIQANDKFFQVKLLDRVEQLITAKRSLRDLKKEFFDLIEEGYEQNGGVPENPRTGEIPDLRIKVRYEANKVWDKTIKELLSHDRLDPDTVRGLNSYFEYGGHGLEFLRLTQATATLGDGGSVGIDGGLENRSIVKSGMNAIEKFADDYWDAKSEEKKAEIKRIQPEILRLIRTSLRGTHIKSINWNLSRLLTHGVSAFVNSMYRRAKEERPGRAKEFWKEAADFCVLRSDNESNRRHRHTLTYAQEVSIERREGLLQEIVKRLESSYDELEKPIIITKLEGRKYVDPVKGLRGLIAGELADRYDKPAMVVVEEKKESDKNPGRYSVSFRLPSRGNIATDMVQLSLKMNPREDINILGHGGHPQASGGTWEVIGGLEKMHKVLDPIFSNFELINPDAGIIKIEKLIDKTTKEIEADGWEDIEIYKEYINCFDIADTIATHMYKQSNPYGSDMPPLILEFEELTVVKISKGTKNDGGEYYSVQVRDKRGNTKTMRLFKDLEDISGIQRGDTLTIRAQPIMRLRALEPCNLQYRLSETFTPSIVTGALARPKLDITKIVRIERNFNKSF